MSVGFHAGRNRQGRAQDQQERGRATSNVGASPAQTDAASSPAPEQKPKGNWRGKVKEMIGDGLLYFFLEFFVFDIIEKIKDHFAKTTGDAVGDKVKQILKEPARDRFTYIVYTKMSEDKTKDLRNWLRRADKDHTEDEKVTLLCKLFEEKNPSLDDDQIATIFEELDKRGYPNFKDTLNRLKHDRFEQWMWRFGHTTAEIPAGILHFAEEAVDKLREPIKDAAEYMYGGAKKGYEWTDGQAEKFAPKVETLAIRLEDRQNEWRMRRRESLLYCLLAFRIGEWYRWKRIRLEHPSDDCPPWEQWRARLQNVQAQKDQFRTRLDTMPPEKGEKQ